jgi:hypothetical protein
MHTLDAALVFIFDRWVLARSSVAKIDGSTAGQERQRPRCAAVLSQTIQFGVADLANAGFVCIGESQISAFIR